jgi:hypothetical protein
MGTKKLFNLRFFIPNPFYFGKCVKITKTLETCYEANCLLLHTSSHFFLPSLRLKVNSMLVRSNHLKLLIRILPGLSTLSHVEHNIYLNQYWKIAFFYKTYDQFNLQSLLFDFC